MSSPSWDYIAKLVCIGDSGCGKSSLTIRLCEGRFVAHHDVTIGVEFGSRIVPVGPPHFSGDFTNDPTSSLFSDDQPTSPSQDANDNNNAPSPRKQKPSPSPGLPAPPTKPVPAPPQKHMKLSLWDTAGQETYKSVTRSYFRGASGALLVFDLSRRSTFLHVTDWLSDLRQIAEPDIVVVLVGNKADLVNNEDDNKDGSSKREVTRKEAEEWARKNGVLEYVETSAKSGENVENAFCRVAERIYQNIQAGKYDLNDRRSGVKGPSAGGTGAGKVKLTGDGGGKGYGGCC
ncbi:P-loop containing nucleoside triphosphate hydrolase protein [Coniochaeta sp. 2T2.1]|nr:P-loop containing nucleoside triphosphate hydrolase protein [Coniochaeta sp. 2T2.1]